MITFKFVLLFSTLMSISLQVPETELNNLILTEEERSMLIDDFNLMDLNKDG